MTMLSWADHSLSPPRVEIPRRYNAAQDLLERNLTGGRASKVAYIDDAGTCTYAELNARVNRFANVLAALDIRREQRVALLLHDTIDYPVAFLGCIKAGVVPVAINTLLSAPDVLYILDDSRACAIVISAPLLESFQAQIAAASSLQQVIVSGPHTRGEGLQELLEQQSDTYSPASTTSDDMCFWLYSSGSTGPPKAAVHVHASLIQTAELYARPIAGYCADDVVFSVSKLPFAYGLGNSLTFPLAVGATAILMAERATPAAIIDRLLRHRPTVLCSIPTSYATLLAQPDLPTREELQLRVCISAGEALPAEVGSRWLHRFGVDILDGIGSTEMLHIYMSNRSGNVCYGTTGRPVPGYEVRIVNEEGQSVPPGEAGELHVRGPSGALFYWNNRARSRSTFLGEWLRTGDKFVQRADGSFVFEGRSDDMIKVGGLYVSPVEVEAALIRHDAVLEAAVVARRDAHGLSKPGAYVVLKPGRLVSVQELQEHVKSYLAPYKYPRWVEILAELPKTATGKIQRFKLREQASQQAADLDLTRESSRGDRAG